MRADRRHRPGWQSRLKWQFRAISAIPGEIAIRSVVGRRELRQTPRAQPRTAPTAAPNQPAATSTGPSMNSLRRRTIAVTPPSSSPSSTTPRNAVHTPATPGSAATNTASGSSFASPAPNMPGSAAQVAIPTASPQPADASATVSRSGSPCASNAAPESPPTESAAPVNTAFGMR